VRSDALAIQVERRIYLIRGEKVMLAFQLAALYGVETKTLNRAVKRNRSRFPADFMFQLTRSEWKSLKCQIGTSNISDRGGIRRALPYAFTELLSNVNLARKLHALEKKYDAQFKVVFDAIRELMTPPEKPKRQIGFYAHD
jgi:ORF6N domain